VQFVWTVSRKVIREKVPRGKLAGRDEDGDEDGDEGEVGDVGDAELSGDAGSESPKEDEDLFCVSRRGDKATAMLLAYSLDFFFNPSASPTANAVVTVNRTSNRMANFLHPPRFAICLWFLRAANLFSPSLHTL